MDSLTLLFLLCLGLVLGLIIDRFVLSKDHPITSSVYLPLSIVVLFTAVVIVIEANVANSTLQILVAIALPLFAALIASRLIDSRIGAPLRHLKESTQNRSKSISVKYFHKDELGELIHEVSKAREQKHDSDQSWSEKEKSLSKGLNSIQSRTKEINESITLQNSNVTETTSTMKELSATSEQTTEKASIVVEAAEKSLELSQVGRDSVNQSIENMTKIREGVENISNELRGLSDQVNMISDFVTKVSNVAKKTNLLAINASIEASKAGDAGKGFSVVSDEIRKLAEQTQGLVQDVDSDISKILHKTDQTKQVTVRGLALVDEGVSQIQETGEVVAESMKQIEVNVVSAQQILAANRQQSIGMEQIAEAIREISSGMAELSKSSDSISSVTASISDAMKQS